MVSPVLRLEFVRAHDGKPAGPLLELPPPGPAKLPAVIDTRPKVPAVVNGNGSGVAVPFKYPRH
jgi:hypothetical protein